MATRVRSTKPIGLPITAPGYWLYANPIGYGISYFPQPGTLPNGVQAAYLGSNAGQVALNLAKGTRQVQGSSMLLNSPGAIVKAVNNKKSVFVNNSGIVTDYTPTLIIAALAGGAAAAEGAAAVGAGGAAGVAGAEGAAAVGAGEAGAATAGGLGASGATLLGVGAISSVTDFLKWIAWLFNPLNWLRVGEFGTGLFLMFFGLYFAFARSRQPTLASTGAGIARVTRELGAASPAGRAQRMARGRRAGTREGQVEQARLTARRESRQREAAREQERGQRRRQLRLGN